ncbi:TPA: DUF1673 domain-containing protein [Methanosarcina acetivorans]|uniref:DUF1673 domain-containing protein n=2 Tax=Methanosarcina acetivorans TaxID=2214 RepID=Q8THM0_METAC|nr:DUF1673 domain-containing protein [Methanosarcina acetivorans]AAM07834.1 predicted protein [Methanosarcina acetivorans C2A]HIH94207.1 DUF1673 domain-containing protein [Methanosarcina acetivorans]
MPAKNVAFENIKKLIGWCPNARSHETQHSLHPEYFDANIPTRGGDTGNSENLSWFRKSSSKILLVDSFLTLTYLLVMTQLGVNIVTLLAGFFLSLTFFIFSWKKQMQRYDTLAQKLVLDDSNKKILYKRLFRIITLIFYATLFYWIFAGDLERNFLMKGTLSFFAGGLAFMWLGYLQILYWEKKNHKTIYFDKGYGKWKNSYIIRERK